MDLKTTIRKIHLWLGMITGPIVFVVALTGAIYAFQEEILDATQSFRFVDSTNGAVLLPSQLMEIGEKANPGKQLHAVMTYKGKRASKLIYYSYAEGYYDFVYVDPRSGEVLKVYDVKNSFFGWILEGHFYLWLPPEIGTVVVSSATLIFLIMLISGIFLWWPRNKSNRKQRFKIKRKARWRRKNYDLHSVGGFYIAFFGFVFAFTGLIWGFEWFRNSVYSVASGGATYQSYSEPASEKGENQPNSMDLVWRKMNAEYPHAGWIEVHVPHDSTHAIAANANPDITTYWKTEYRYFDQKTMADLKVKHQWGKTADASFADTLMRINYDIHTGAVFGLFGKSLLFIASMIIASLPITGFLIWYGRRKKSRSPAVVSS